jgi:hypothetical protein
VSPALIARNCSSADLSVERRALVLGRPRGDFDVVWEGKGVLGVERTCREDMQGNSYGDEVFIGQCLVVLGSGGIFWRGNYICRSTVSYSLVVAAVTPDASFVDISRIPLLGLPLSGLAPRPRLSLLPAGTHVIVHAPDYKKKEREI